MRLLKFPVKLRGLARLLAMAGLAAALAAPARAASPYTVADVHVDASAASSTEALNIAVAQGRPKAWTILYRRLTRQEDWPRQPALDPQTLLRISRGYTIANERRSTTRYVADVTYIFNARAVSRILQQAGIAFTQGPSRRILVVPLSPGFQGGAWADALSQLAPHEAIVPFAVAAAGDASLKGVNFDTASWGDVSVAAHRAGANEAALVQAVYADNKVTVNIKRLGIGEAPVTASVDVPLQQTVGTTYPAAAQAAVMALENLWKSRAVVDLSQHGRLLVNVRMSSLAQWGAIQSALAGIDTVTGYTVTAMDIGYAQLAITYLGSPDQLRDSLGAAGLALAPARGGTWTLAMNGGP